MKDLYGKKALITGGAMGIGLATARRLVKEGCTITIWDLNEAAMQDAAKELQALGGTVYCHRCDITDEQRVNELARQAEIDMGQVDILINNAGMVVAGEFCTHTPAEWERETKVNLSSMYYTLYAFLPGMYRRNLGHVVNVSSSAGLCGMPDLAVYCATKWAVYGLTESLRCEALRAHKAVHFSSIHPGILKQGMFEGSKFNLLGDILIPRVDTHDEIAEVIVKKALKKNRTMVVYPRILQLGLFVRAFFPDIVFNRLLLLAGADKCMHGWTGRPGSQHASR